MDDAKRKSARQDPGTPTPTVSAGLATPAGALVTGRPGPVLTITRALARRCPNCGSGNIFRSYFNNHEQCPGCGLKFERGERDYFIGAYTINLIVAELIVFFGGLAALLATWPEVPWDGLMYGLVALMIVAPIVLYPLSRQVWLACDLILRPAEESDFDIDSASGVA